MSMSPEVWHSVSRTNQALICIFFGLAKCAHVAVEAARAACVSKDVLQAEVRLAPCPTGTSVID